MASILKYAADTGHNILCDAHDIQALNKEGCFDEAAKAYMLGESTGYKEGYRDGYKEGHREGYKEAAITVALLALFLLASKW